MRDTCRRGRYVDLGSEWQIVPNGGSKPSEPSEDLLRDEVLDVRHLVRARARGLPRLSTSIDIIAPEPHGISPPTAMPESTQRPGMIATQCVPVS